MLKIDGRCRTPAQFRAHVDKLNWNSWRPAEIILHHTWKPTLETWEGIHTIEAMRRVYEQRGWTSGPHVFVAPDGIWLFTPLTEPGTHVSGRNHLSIGIEMVGNYDETKPCGPVWANTLAVLRTLLDALELDEIAFHRDYADKSCPGWAVTKDWVYEQLKEVQVSKLGIHFQEIPKWAYELDIPAGFPVVLINPPKENPFPGAFIIGRAWIGGDNVEQEYIANRDGKGYFDRCKEFYDRAPYVDVWLGPNEPCPYWAQSQDLDAFNAEWIPCMHGIDKKTAAGVFSVGGPDWPVLQNLRQTCALTDYLALHEYGNPTMGYESAYLSLRHRLATQKLRDLGYRVPPILITETGIDGGAIAKESDNHLKRVGEGWVTIVGNQAEFLAQMAWYDNELQKDPYVVAALPFVSGPNSDWKLFEWNEAMVKWAIAKYRDNSPDSSIDIPVDIPADNIREAAWNNVGINYNPDAAFAAKARELGLGAPLGNEDYGSTPGYALQAFVGGVLYARVGDWGNIRQVEW